MSIPPEARERSPLISEESYATWQAIEQDGDAPKWNHRIGDRIEASDIQAARLFLAQMHQSPSVNGQPAESILSWVMQQKEKVWSFEQRLQRCRNIDELRQQWDRIDCVDRGDLTGHMAQHVPHELDFDRAVIYDTSGTTGHPMEIFHHPQALAQNHIFADLLFQRLGIDPEWSPQKMGCLNICAQRHTFVFCNTFSIWKGSGFAKINLHEADWTNGVPSARAFCHRWNPSLVTSDPISLSTAMRWQLPIRPKLIFSTAIGLTPELQAEIQAHFGCPVINWYAATEVGPIACSLPDRDGLFVLAPDLFVEVVDELGVPVEDGEMGEICVTGGRNPYLPLLRYRTGDFARRELSYDQHGQCRHVLHELQGREWVSFVASHRQVVNSVDVDRIIRDCGVFVQHQVHQDAAQKVHVRLRPVEHLPPNETGMLRRLQELFGAAIDIEIEMVPNLGDSGKIRPYICECTLA